MIQTEKFPLEKQPPAVTMSPMLRFAVAAFNGWPDALRVSEELRSGAKPLQEISYLGLRPVLESGPAQPLASLSFPSFDLACSTGPVADRLAARVDTGAPSLQAALANWLIPRHAAQLQRAIQKGRIVVWVRLADPDDERRAYRALLAGGCGSVGVHDLVGG